MKVFLERPSKFRPTAHKPSRPYLPKKGVNLQVTSNNDADSELTSQRLNDNNQNMNSRPPPLHHHPQLAPATPAITTTTNPQTTRLEILLVTLAIGIVLVLLPASTLWLCMAFDRRRRRRRRGLRHSSQPPGYHHGLDGSTDAPSLSWMEKSLLPLALGEESISGWGPSLPRSQRMSRFGNINAAADRVGVVLNSLLRHVGVVLWSGMTELRGPVASSRSLRGDVESGHAEVDGEVYPSRGREVLGAGRGQVARKRGPWHSCSLRRREKERDGRGGGAEVLV